MSKQESSIVDWIYMDNFLNSNSSKHQSRACKKKNDGGLEA